MGTSNLSADANGACTLQLTIQNQNIDVTLMIMDGLCSDIILGHDVLQIHEALIMRFGGFKPTLRLCVLAEANIEPVSLFTNLLPFDKPIAVKSRRHSDSNSQFIEAEIRKLLNDKII